MIVQYGKEDQNTQGIYDSWREAEAALAFLAYAFTDNLSTAIIIFCITAGMIFVAHPKTRIFLIIAGTVILFVAIIVLIIGQTVQQDRSISV